MAVTQESKSYCEFFVKTYIVTNTDNEKLSYRRETALQAWIVTAKSRRLEMGDNIDIIGLPSTTVINRPAKLQISEKKNTN